MSYPCICKQKYCRRCGRNLQPPSKPSRPANVHMDGNSGMYLITLSIDRRELNKFKDNPSWYCEKLMKSLMEEVVKLC